jgi:Protein of unknown function (DUF2628)
VLRIVGRWAPESAGRIDRHSLPRSGIVVRLALGDAEAPALLRELYATGMAPTDVMLRPVIGAATAGRGDVDRVRAIFAAHDGRFVPTWNWTAFVFGPLWYLRRGLYGKGLVLLGLSVCPFFTLAATLLLSAVVLVYCGVAGNWDDYLWKVRGTQWWA